MIRMISLNQNNECYDIPEKHRGLPVITYAPRGMGGGVKLAICFNCVLNAKRGGGGPDSM